MYFNLLVWSNNDYVLLFLQVIVISATWILLFGFLSSFSPHYYWIIALRCLVGFGIGGAPQS